MASRSGEAPREPLTALGGVLALAHNEKWHLKRDFSCESICRIKDVET
jgi:hypothetical protein